MHTSTRTRTRSTQTVPLVLIDPVSVPGHESDACRKLDSHILFDHIQRRGYWQIPNAAHLLRAARLLNGGREDWKWHSINRNCQTIKQCKQHRWATDESGCQKPFSEAKPSRLNGRSICPPVYLHSQMSWYSTSTLKLGTATQWYIYYFTLLPRIRFALILY